MDFGCGAGGEVAGFLAGAGRRAILRPLVTHPLLAVLLALVSGAASAAPRLLAIHPLVVSDAEPADAAELTRHFEALLAKVPTPKVDAATVARFLDGQPGKHCAADDAGCFAGLAEASGATRILFVSMRLYPVVVSGRLLGADGKALAEAPLKKVDKPKGKLLDAAKQALSDLVQALPLDATSELLVPLVKDPPPAPEKGVGVVVPPENPVVPPVVPVKPKEEPGWERPVGLVLGGVGVVGLAAGGVLLITATDRFNKAAEGSHGADLPQLRELQSQAQAQQLTGALFLGVGVVALASGGYLVLTHGAEEAGPSAALVALPGGVAVVGQFP